MLAPVHGRLEVSQSLRQTAGRVAVTVLVGLLAGCASFSPDAGMGTVQAVAGTTLDQRIVALRSEAEVDAAHGRVRRLLHAPLSATAAVQVALLNNRELQASFHALRVSEAAMVATSLPPNPTVSVSSIAGGGGLEIERQIAGDILALATLPARAEIAAERFRQAQRDTALTVLRTAAQTRRAYYRAVAARAIEDFLNQSQAAAEATSQLSQRLGESGAVNKLDQARNQVFDAELLAELANARRRTVSERERLIRDMGLWGSDLTFRLPSVLPSLPARPQTRPAIEVEAVSRRADLQMARIEVDALAKSYGLTGATRFLNLLDASGVSKTVREPGSSRFVERGVAVELQVPLFDFGAVRVREAEETYMQAVDRLAAQAVNVRSEAREAYQDYRAAYDLVRHYEREVLPLRKIISDETLLRYNAMQIDVFALLAEARQRIGSTVASIQAQQDFRLAEINLQAAVVGGGTNGMGDDRTGKPSLGLQSAGNEQ
jgi:outer membrane protein TolC